MIPTKVGMLSIIICNGFLFWFTFRANYKFMSSKYWKITGCPLWLEMLENEPFSECGWKSWKTLGFSSALGGKAGILFLGLIIINSIIE